MPRFPSAQGRLNHEPGFHLSCDENLSEGWGPPLIPTPRLVIVLGGTGVDSTLCGHLPKFVARRVRLRLPPPPPSPADARTPGSVLRQNEFFRGFQAIVSSFGRRAGEASRA